MARPVFFWLCLRKMAGTRAWDRFSCRDGEEWEKLKLHDVCGAEKRDLG